MDDHHYDLLIRAIYDGVLSSNGWQEVLKELRSLTNSEEDVMLLMERSTGTVLVGESYGIDPAQIEDYELNYAADDPGKAFVDRIALGDWYFDVRDLGYRTIGSHAFYQNFMHEHELGSIMWTPLFRSGTVHAALSFVSGATRSPYQPEDAMVVSPLLPHLATAAMLRWRFQELSRLAQFGQTLLDRLQSPLMIINDKAHILFSNAAAQTWLSKANHPFSSRSAQTQGVVKSELLSFARQICSRRGAGIASMKINVGGGAKPTYLLGLPLQDDHPAAQGWLQPVGVVVILGPGIHQAPPTQLLKSLFVLTPAECRLVEKLSECHCLTGATSALHISVDTGRTQLKSVFQKTGSHNQSELMRLVTELSQIH